jgi:hypothetical protein
MLTSCKFIIMVAKRFNPALEIEQIVEAKRVFAVKLPGFALNGSEVFVGGDRWDAAVSSDSHCILLASAGTRQNRPAPAKLMYGK